MILCPKYIAIPTYMFSFIIRRNYIVQKPKGISGKILKELYN